MEENLAAQLDEKTLTEIAEQVIEETKQDDESRQDWLEKHAHWIDLYFQNDAPINPPWSGASTESMPILAEACNQFHSRAFRAFFPSRQVVKAIPVGEIDEQSEQRADRIGKHMSWQLLVKDKSYKRDKDSLLLSVCIHGSHFTKTYYDPLRRKNCVENVRAEDLIVPYGYGPRSITDIERKTHQIWLSPNSTKFLEAKGVFVGHGESWLDENQSPTTDARDKAEGLSPQQRRSDKPCRILEQHRLLPIESEMYELPYIVTVDAQSRKVLRIVRRFEVDESPIEYFTHYMFMPNPDGFYGLGMGHLVGNINTAVNKLLRQTIDANTLSTIGNHSGFVSDQLGIRGGELEFSLGKFRKVPANAEDLAKGIWTPKYPGPSPTGFQAISMLMQRGDRLATVTEAVTGQTDKVMQPTTVLSLIEQSQQVFSTVYERLFGSWEEELAKIYRLNGEYLDEQEYFSFLDVNGPQNVTIGKGDYAPDFQVMAITDPKMATEQQKLAKAEIEYNFLAQNPLVQQNPNAFYAASKAFAEAIQMDDIDRKLPPPPQQEQVRQDDPALENMAFMMPGNPYPMPFMDQEHLLHIQAHEEFLASPYGQMLQQLNPEVLQVVKTHLQMHYAMMFGDLETPMLEQLNGLGEPGGIAPPAGNEGIPAGIGGAVQPGPLEIGQGPFGAGAGAGPAGSDPMDFGSTA